MRRPGQYRKRFRPQQAVAALLLFSQMVCISGIPIAVGATRSRNGSSQSYPCWGHACGCATADECWQGDCCCFTLEEKLAWADANAIEPPAHVRPLVASRKSHPIPKTKPSCCHADEENAACSHHSKCDLGPNDDCPACARNGSAEIVQSSSGQTIPDWVLAFRAQKCRGEGPMGLFTLPPSLVPKLVSAGLPEAECLGLAPTVAPSLIAFSARPPTPPPRCS
jgi:hypothetical protein